MKIHLEMFSIIYGGFFFFFFFLNAILKSSTVNRFHIYTSKMFGYLRCLIHHYFI